MRDRRTRVMVAIIAVVSLVAACSETRAGTPAPSGDSTTDTSAEPGPTTPPTSSEAGNRYGAPRVDNPLDATQYLSRPCAAITPRLLQSLGLPSQGKSDTTSAIGRRAPSCDWRAGAELASVGFLKGNENGLADLYRGNSTRLYVYWEETAVEGHPGVFYDSVDSRSKGECSIAVGLSDALAVAARESGQLGAASCERAKDIAAAVIKTLKGQG